MMLQPLSLEMLLNLVAVRKQRNRILIAGREMLGDDPGDCRLTELESRAMSAPDLRL
jgi:hypothetical protein